jgi:signal transduction histidine kinase
MSSIVGYTDLLLGESVGILGALQKKFLERIKASTERMSSLVEDLIQMTVVSSGRSELDAERVDLAPIIDEAMSLTMNQLREKNITLRVDLPDKLPQVGADRDAVQQILLHLLKNAGLRVSVQEQNKQADYVLLQVADTGGGIPPEELPRVFSRLYRSDNALIQGVGDNGIGLSIVKSLVEAVGGRIWVDTEMEVGSTFSVLLPVANHHGGQEGQPG